MQIACSQGEKERSDDAYNLNLKRASARSLSDASIQCRSCRHLRARPVSSGPPGRIPTRSSTLRNTRCVNLTLAVMLAIHISARPATTTQLAEDLGGLTTERRNCIPSSVSSLLQTSRRKWQARELNLNILRIITFPRNYLGIMLGIIWNYKSTRLTLWQI